MFVKVVETGSFRGASAALRMPKSTVSYKVGLLEDRLGVRLLERTTRALRLTDAGRRFHAEVAPPLEALERATHRAAELRDEPSGRLRITLPVELGQLVLGGIVTEYMRRYPAVALEIDLTDRRVDLIEEGYDLAVRVGPLPASTLIARKLGEPRQLKLHASRAYIKEHGAPRHPRELVKHSCLVMSSSQTPAEWRFLGKRGQFVVSVRPRLAVNSYRLLAECVAAGLGIAFLPSVYAAPLLDKRLVTSVLDEFALPPVAWHVVYPSARHLSRKVRAFVELLEERFESALES